MGVKEWPSIFARAKHLLYSVNCHLGYLVESPCGSVETVIKLKSDLAYNIEDKKSRNKSQKSIEFVGQAHQKAFKFHQKSIFQRATYKTRHIGFGAPGW
jgi:hypothetical protein